MRYALLINERPGSYSGLDEGDRDAVTAEYLTLRADPRVLAGHRLVSAASATTVRMGDDGEVWLTDGPFAETKEVFGGYYILDAPDLDAALEFARRVPAVRLGGSVEVRAVARD